MKVITIIQGNIYQIVLTPENKEEERVIALINSKSIDTTLAVGNFSECQGGWLRYYPAHSYIYDEDKIDSLMIVLKDKVNEF